MKAVNKWNRNIYEIVSRRNGKVLLRRSDGSEFEIGESEFKFSYVEK
jgi:hypothetical protein